MTREEYEAKYHSNTKITGVGIDTTMHMPCPFCAEPDFIVHTILETEEAYTKGGICFHCKRGARGIFKHDRGSILVEFIQTQGDDPPDYLKAPRDAWLQINTDAP